MPKTNENIKKSKSRSQSRFFFPPPDTNFPTELYTGAFYTSTFFVELGILITVPPIKTLHFNFFLRENSFPYVIKEISSRNLVGHRWEDCTDSLTL